MNLTDRRIVWPTTTLAVGVILSLDGNSKETKVQPPEGFQRQPFICHGGHRDAQVMRDAAGGLNAMMLYDGSKVTWQVGPKRGKGLVVTHFSEAGAAAEVPANPAVEREAEHMAGDFCDGQEIRLTNE